MVVAEHLALVTQVEDRFSSDLARLSGLLETVGEQADQLDPIRIRVAVDDRQLKQLNRRLAGTQAQDALNATDFSSGAGVPDGKDHTLEDSVGERIADSVENAMRDITPIGGGNRGVPFSAAVGGAIGASGDGGGGGAVPDGDGSGSRIPDADDFLGALNIDSLNNAIEDEVFDPLRVTRGQSPFQFSEDVFDNQFSTRAFTSAFHSDMLVDALGLDSAAQLAGVSSDDLIDLDDNFETLGDAFEGLINGSEELDPMFSRSKFQRAQLLQQMKRSRVGLTEFYDILAALLPLIGVLVGAIPAVVGGLVALGAAALGAATALGGIVGLGALGAASQEAGGGMPSAEDFTALFEGVGEEFFEAFESVGEDLAPLFEDGVDALGPFFDRLAGVATMLPQLSSEARAFGNFVTDFIVGGLDNLIKFADAAGPIFEQIGSFLSEVNFTQGLASVLRMTLPLLSHLGSLIVDIIPGLLRFSAGLGDVLIVVSQVLSTIVRFLSFIAGGPENLGRFIGVLLSLASAFFLVNNVVSLADSKLGSYIIKNIISTKQTVAATVSNQGYAASFLQLGSTIAVATAKLVGFIAVAAVATAGLSVVTSALLGGTAAAFAQTSSSIDEATNSLREFERQQSRMASKDGLYMGDLDRNVYVNVNQRNSVSVEGDMSPQSSERVRSFFDSEQESPSMLQ